LHACLRGVMKLPIVKLLLKRDERTPATAITRGVDPAEKKLHPAMPIYTMSEEDLDALVAYINQLGTELDPGLTQAIIRIGTILPMESPLKEIGEAARRTIQAYFDEVIDTSFWSLGFTSQVIFFITETS